MFHSSGRACHTPDIECNPSVALATAGNSWKQASADESAPDGGGSAAGRDASEGECSLGVEHTHTRGSFRTAPGCRHATVHVPYLAACRCQPTAAAPSRPPWAWSRRSHDRRSPAGCRPPGRRDASARRRWSLHRTAAMETETPFQQRVAVEMAPKSAATFAFPTLATWLVKAYGTVWL